MLGLWLQDCRLSLRRDIPRPTPGPGEVLIKVLEAGICSTDHQLVRGMYAFTGIIGHEFVGCVIEGPEELVGSRVVGEINASCGECGACRAGMRKHCPRRTVLGISGRNGAFAEYLTLPQSNVHRVPHGVDTGNALFTEPLAAALEIQEQIKISVSDRVLVVGDGKLGQLIALTLSRAGCHLVVLGRHQQKLRHLRLAGIDTLMGGDVPRGEFDIAIECTGNDQGFVIARQSLRPRGALVLKSTYCGALSVDVTSLVVDEIRLLGSRCGPFSKALTLLEHGDLDLSYLVSAEYPLRRSLEGFEHSMNPGVLKVKLLVAE
ncbi:MAG: alcohol dehydrogenase catalytic domain-containing protein [Candidatus Krumholzibacteria bacterium]|nr:alcohol dehydrogenase catalytic domain-containing protein [Candidatus Krumholzibacteria bacterium]